MESRVTFLRFWGGLGVVGVIILINRISREILRVWVGEGFGGGGGIILINRISPKILRIWVGEGLGGRGGGVINYSVQ